MRGGDLRANAFGVLLLLALLAAKRCAGVSLFLFAAWRLPLSQGECSSGSWEGMLYVVCECYLVVAGSR